MIKFKSYSRRLFVYSFLVITLFAILVIIFQSNRERAFRRSQLENTLNNITILTHNYIEENGLFEADKLETIDSLMLIVPHREIRVSIIDSEGHVVYDSEVDDIGRLDNHAKRPEVVKSLTGEFGANMRASSSTGRDYYYLARFYQDYYVRTAVIYDTEIVQFLKADRLFLIVMLFIFLIIWLVWMLVIRNSNKTISGLKDFAVKLNEGDELRDSIKFPKDELGIIGRQIVEIYKNLKTAKDELTLEKEKLFNHLYALNVGVAFFSARKKKLLTNNHFIQYVNIISEESSISAEHFFDVNEFGPITDFIDRQLKDEKEIAGDSLPQYEHLIQKEGKYFTIKCIIFQDHSFEIMITDTTKNEKRRLLKQQMTSNIAHELKTPVSSVMGYLETLMNNNIDDEKKAYFLEKANAQAVRLTELINDLSILNKIEEAKDHFELEDLRISEIIEEVVNNEKTRLEDKKVELNMDIKKQLSLHANRSLIFSIFHNLIDNTINYAGENVSIDIANYLEDQNFIYFSFSDNGPGIPEEHFPRIFERFYRVDSGRSRKTGGTGLGLAIVKNAVQLHGGNISVRNRKEGGLEFLFTLAK